MLLDFLFLPILFFIGFITSYQDFKEGKIKNKWIILGLVWGLGIYFLLLIWALIAPYLSQIFSKEFIFILPSYILKVFINSALALIVGYLLWYFNFWSAGDAKLFFIFSLLLPLKYYWQSALPYFPSFALLINIFILVLIFLMGQNIFYFLKSISLSKISVSKAVSLNYAKFKTNYLTYLKTFFGFFLIFIVFQIIKIELDNFIGKASWWSASLMLLLVIVRKPFNKVFQKNWFLILSFLGLVFYLNSPYSHFSLLDFPALIKNSLFFMAIFVIISLLTSMFEESQKKHLPFAIWVMLGTLITIIIKGSLINWLIQFLH